MTVFLSGGLPLEIAGFLLFSKLTVGVGSCLSRFVGVVAPEVSAKLSVWCASDKPTSFLSMKIVYGDFCNSHNRS